MYCRLGLLMTERDSPLSQRQLARETRLSTTTVNQLYQNKFKRVDVETINTLCNYFECEIEDLFVMREIEE